MSINYEMKYAYTEVYEIINYLGKEYIDKIPKKVYNLIKSERRIDYKPEIDFKKPLNLQPLKQETRNLIAYLNYYYWCTDEVKRVDLVAKIEKNIAEKKRLKEEERKKEIAMRAKNYTTVTGAIDQSLKKNTQ